MNSREILPLADWSTQQFIDLHSINSRAGSIAPVKSVFQFGAPEGFIATAPTGITQHPQILSNST
jgi:hypothetical protein